MSITINNDYISLSIKEHGATMCSIIDKENNEQLQYQGDERAWMGQDVVIFPFVARLKNKTYTVNGNEYHMENHGLARYNDFKIEELKNDYVCLSFKYDENTLSQYPFKFVLYVSYKLNEKTINIEYKVKNLDDKEMYFEIGGHPAMKVDVVEKEELTDISGNYVEFEKELDLYKIALDDTGCFMLNKEYYKKTKTIELSKKLFDEEKTLILDATNINKVTLNRKNGRKISYEFNNLHFLALWSHPQYGDYVCVEPWMSLPDFVDCDLELKNKKTIMTLPSNEEYVFNYKITI